MLLSTLSKELNNRFTRDQQSTNQKDFDEEINREIQLDRMNEQNRKILEELDDMHSDTKLNQCFSPTNDSITCSYQ